LQQSGLFYNSVRKHVALLYLCKELWGLVFKVLVCYYLGGDALGFWGFGL